MGGEALRSKARWFGRVLTTIFVAWRTLTGERRRWAVSTAALGVAAMLVLFLEGTSRWIVVSSTAYLEHTGAQLVVAQRGIDNLLFAQSTFSETTLDQVRDLNGVASVDSVVGVNGVVAVNGAHLPVYLVGFSPGHGGGPWSMAAGSGQPHGSEVVVDVAFARTAHIHLGQKLDLFGRQLRVTGMSAGTAAAGDFFMFVPLSEAQAIAGSGLVSFGLVHINPGTPTGTVAAEVGNLPGVHAIALPRIAANDRAMILTSFAQPVQIIVLVGLVTGVLIAGVVLYTATVEHARDYAVLKAIGAGAGTVYGSALLQALVLSLFGVLLGLALAAGLAAAVDRWDPVIASRLDPDLVGEVSAAIVAVNLLAASLPVRHVSRIDPQEVFKA